MTARIEITRKGSGVRDLAKRLRDMSKPMREIAQMLHGEALESFRGERDPWGAPWAPHSPVTIARRRSRRVASGGERKLQDRGFLMSGLSPSSTKTKAKVSASGPAAPYAAVHQFGNPSNRFPNTPQGAPAPIPARPFLPIRREGGRLVTRLPKAVMAEIRDIIRRHFRDR